MAVGRHGAQHTAFCALSVVQVDAVQIIARLFRGDRKARLVDEAAQLGCVHLEFHGGGFLRHGLEVGGRQGRQREFRTAGRDREAAFRQVERDFGAFGELPHNIKKRLGGGGDGTGLFHGGFGRIRRLDVEVGRREAQPVAFRHHQDVGQDRNRVPALDDCLDVGERTHQGVAVDGQLHKPNPVRWRASAGAGGLPKKLRPALRGRAETLADCGAAERAVLKAIHAFGRGIHRRRLVVGRSGPGFGRAFSLVVGSDGRVPREGGGPVGRFALAFVQGDWIPAFAGNADLKVRFQRRRTIPKQNPSPVSGRGVQIVGLAADQRLLRGSAMMRCSSWRSSSAMPSFPAIMAEIFR